MSATDRLTPQQIATADLMSANRQSEHVVELYRCLADLAHEIRRDGVDTEASGKVDALLGALSEARSLDGYADDAQQCARRALEVVEAEAVRQ